LVLPSRRISAGTTSALTSEASTITATAMPTPMDLMVTTLASANARNTHAMIAAAPVTRRPLRSSPSATAVRLSPVRCHASCMRVSKNTS
jgi:hypothetical protein